VAAPFCAEPGAATAFSVKLAPSKKLAIHVILSIFEAHYFINYQAV